MGARLPIILVMTADIKVKMTGALKARSDKK